MAWFRHLDPESAWLALGVGDKISGVESRTPVRFLMKRLTLTLLLLTPAALLSQSPFDGGWIIDENFVQQSEKPKPVT